MAEVIEQDTHDNEDIKNLKDFVWQDVKTEEIDTFLQCSLAYNKRLFDAWVKQPSACCGAASVAGAWNALCCYHRKDAGALTHVDILRIYHSMFIDIVDRHTRAFERRLGAPLGTLIEQLEIELAKKGREIGGKKGFGASKGTVVAALKRLARSRLGNRGPLLTPTPSPTALADVICNGDNGCDNGVPPTIPSDAAMDVLCARDAIDCVIELFESDGVVFMPDIPGVLDDVGDAGGGEEDDEEDEEEGAGDEHDDDNGKKSSTGVLVNIKGKRGSAVKSTAPGAATTNEWEWQKDFMSIVKNIAGMRKITAPRASTAAVGNWGILQATERLSEWTGLGTGLHARLFMGKRRTVKTKIDVPLSRKDDSSAVVGQWEALKAAFGRPDTVLLFHLKNHYALIFSLREWLAPAPPAAGSSSGAGVKGADELAAGDENQVNGSSTVHENNTTGNHPPTSVQAPTHAPTPAPIHPPTHPPIHPPTHPPTHPPIHPPVVRRQLLAARKGQRPYAWIDFDEARETMLGWEGYKVMAISHHSSVSWATLRQATLVVPEEYAGVVGDKG